MLGAIAFVPQGNDRDRFGDSGAQGMSEEISVNRTAIVLGGGAIVAAGAIVAGILIFVPGAAKSADPNAGSATPSVEPIATGMPSSTGPTLTVTANEQGIVRPADIADPDERRFLLFLDAASLKYPASYAAIYTGRRAALAVCSFYGAPEWRRDGDSLMRVIQATPEWAKNDPKNMFNSAVFATMCSGTQPKR